MKEIIYHGSDHIVSNPQYGFGKSSNDYGRGFYCTKELELAKEWACAANTDGYVNVYELDFTGLSILNLNSEEYSILHWLAILTRFRSYWQEKSIAKEAKDFLQKNYFIDLQGYDVIIGYRADDSYFSFAQDFVGGAISLQQLEKAMRLGKLGEQICLKSEKAFSQIFHKEVMPVDAGEYFLKKTNRDLNARKEYRVTKNQAVSIHDTFMLDLMRRSL